jgi:hypothetical protein
MAWTHNLHLRDEICVSEPEEKRVLGKLWHMWENYPKDVCFERETRNKLALDRIQWCDVGEKVINWHWIESSGVMLGKR